MNDKPLIALANDDGIDSPGLWAMAETLSPLGELWITAPSQQYSCAGMSYDWHCDCHIAEQESRISGVRAFAVGASPAQVVVHAVEEILPRHPDLLVSGINYGANLGLMVYGSGTIGAALEAAGYRIPAMAVSLETTPKEGYFNQKRDLDFGPTARFAAKWAAHILDGKLPKGIDILKIDTPSGCTDDTPWKWFPLSTANYWRKTPKRTAERDYLQWSQEPDWVNVAPDTDIDVVARQHKIAVCPMKLDMTASIDPTGFVL